MQGSHAAAIFSGALFVFYGCGESKREASGGGAGAPAGRTSAAGRAGNGGSGGKSGVTSSAGKAGINPAGGASGEAGSSENGGTSGRVASAGHGGTSSHAGQGGTSSHAAQGGMSSASGGKRGSGAGQAGTEGGASASAGGANGGAGDDGAGNGGDGVVKCARGPELIENGDFEGGNFAFATEYRLVTLPAQITTTGACIIATDPSGVREGESGWASYGDHTSGSGSMLVCDGNETVGRYAWSQTVPVEPHAWYTLSFRVSTVESSTSVASLPSVVGLADGVPLGGALMADPTAGTWLAPTALYQAGDNTSVTLSIEDTNTAAIDNDFSIDDISFVLTCVE